jgi:hypothetical protein
MKIIATLSNSAGELDRRTIENDDLDVMDSAELSEAIWDAIDDWVLSPGDTIKIIDSEEGD